jgi:prepilin signal peptidase PulO-like enzyme (type II secretory pathway)
MVQLSKVWSVRKVSKGKLRKGDVLVRDGKANSFLIGEDDSILIRPEGLSEKDVAKLYQDKGTAWVRIHQTIPFAPFISFGALLCILIGGNIIIYILQFL